MGLFGESVPKTVENFVSLVVVLQNLPSFSHKLNLINSFLDISVLFALEKKEPESLESRCTTKEASSTVSVSSSLISTSSS